jgi:radical SAM superfamily enzyme YgiQ (UPF0313 family)
VIGFPGETKDTIRETIDFINDIKPDILQVAIATPIPGTEFYNWCKDNSYLLNEDLETSLNQNGFQKCIISYPWLRDYEIEMCVNEILRNYYISFYYFKNTIKNTFNMNGFNELKVLIKSGIDFLIFMYKY